MDTARQSRNQKGIFQPRRSRSQQTYFLNFRELRALRGEVPLVSTGGDGEEREPGKSSRTLVITSNTHATWLVNHAHICARRKNSDLRLPNRRCRSTGLLHLCASTFNTLLVQLKRIAVIGGGVVGLATALKLGRHYSAYE